MIPYARQDVTDTDIDAVVDVLRSDFLTQGPVVPAFESAVAEHCGAARAVAVNSATSGLHLACLALGIGPGDCVWTSPITFVASANCARHCGARVDFVDVEPGTANMSIDKLSEKLHRAAQNGQLPKALIAVHFAGQSCEMSAIRGLADRFGFAVIEDGAHAFGGRYRGNRIGSCDYSDVTVFSYHPVKIITTGEGGMLLTNDVELGQRIATLRSHGVTRDPRAMSAHDPEPWVYEQTALGFNFRMTDLQAALGLSQISRADAYVERRRELAARYDLLLRGLSLNPLEPAPDTESSWHLYVVRLAVPADRCRVFERLRSHGIRVNVHYVPVYLQPYYRQLGFSPRYCPDAEDYYAGALSLPLHARLTTEEQDTIVAALTEALAC